MTTDDLDQEQQDDPGRLRRMYEEAAATAAAAEARAAELERREVFRNAGLDPTKPLHQAVMKAYDGPFEPDAVKSHIADLGLTEAPPAPAPAAVPASEQEALVRIAQASMGGEPPAQPDKREELRKELADAAKHGATNSELDAIAIRFSQAGGYRTAWDHLPH